MRPLLGCFVEIGARGHAAGGVLDAGFACIERAQQLWSFHDPASELSRLNGRPGQRVAVCRGTWRLLRLAQAMQQCSGGAFDCTVGGTLVRLGRLPDHGGPAPLPHGDAADLEFGPGWVRLRRPVRVTLDGIAKGFAVDLAVAAMKRQGASSGWVNAGGDLRAFGDVGVPVRLRADRGGFPLLGDLRDAAVASSRVGPGAEPRDDRFPGLLVGARQRPPASGLWTVLARSAWRADALTKVAALALPSARGEAVARLGGHLVDRGPR